VIDIPGQTRPEEIVVLSAHLDSLSTRLDALAPGADDNASGVAAVLEAARVFRTYRFARTLRLIIFTGEEAVEVGSRAYLADHPPTGVIGAINLDMIAYDKDNDRCMELHTGPLPASLPLARCIQESISAYQLDLKTEIVAAGASDQSDQSSFWAHGVGAVLLWENTNIPAAGDGACAGTDANPFYHTPNDRLDRLNLETGIAAARAGIAAAAALAQPLGACRSQACDMDEATPARLYWQALQKRVIK
jgi:Zn-dependent M28 family amino/carboxypeptidase